MWCYTARCDCGCGNCRTVALPLLGRCLRCHYIEHSTHTSCDVASCVESALCAMARKSRKLGSLDNVTETVALKTVGSRRNVRGKKGGLRDMPTMPLDLLFEV